MDDWERSARDEILRIQNRVALANCVPRWKPYSNCRCLFGREGGEAERRAIRLALHPIFFDKKGEYRFKVNRR